MARRIGIDHSTLSPNERGETRPNEEVLEFYIVNYGVDRSRIYELSRRLDVLYTRRRTARRPKRGELWRPPTVESDPEEIAACYQIEERSSKYSINEQGAITSMSATVRIRATKDYAEFYRMTHGRDGGGWRGMYRLKAGEGATIGRMVEGEDGVISAVFKLDRRALRSDAEPYTFSYTINSDPAAPSQPWVRHCAPTGGIRSYILQVKFLAPGIVHRVSRFRSQTLLGTKGDPESGDVFPYAHDGVYAYTFRDIRPREYCGFNWTLMRLEQ